MKKIAVILTYTDTTNAKVFLHSTKDEAIEQMQQLYLKELREARIIDYNNTFYDSESEYAQVAYGLEAIEMRIAQVS